MSKCWCCWSGSSGSIFHPFAGTCYRFFRLCMWSNTAHPHELLSIHFLAYLCLTEILCTDALAPHFNVFFSPILRCVHFALGRLYGCCNRRAGGGSQVEASSLRAEILQQQQQQRKKVWKRRQTNSKPRQTLNISVNCIVATFFADWLHALSAFLKPSMA